jgi:hypothetical protein
MDSKLTVRGGVTSAVAGSASVAGPGLESAGTPGRRGAEQLGDSSGGAPSSWQREGHFNIARSVRAATATISMGTTVTGTVVRPIPPYARAREPDEILDIGAITMFARCTTTTPRHRVPLTSTAYEDGTGIARASVGRYLSHAH